MERHISIERSPIFLRFDFISVRSHPPRSSFESSLHFPPLPLCLSLFLALLCSASHSSTRTNPREKKMRNEREKRGSTKKVGEKILEVVSVISIPQETLVSVWHDSFLRLTSSAETFSAKREREREKILRNWPTGGWKLRSRHSDRQDGTGNCLFVPNTTT